MYFPASFTKEIAQELRCRFSKIGTDTLVGISTYTDMKKVRKLIELYVEATEESWEDPIIIEQIDDASCGEVDVCTMELSCADGDDPWQVVLAQLDFGTLVCFDRR